MTPAPSFDLIGDSAPASPVILSVPHAGRDYPPAMRDQLRVPFDALRPLEDRHVDALALAARTRETALVARRPRAWIDLNRAEHERDPLVDDGANPAAAPYPSLKAQGGLGLVPRRAGRNGGIWARRLAADDVAARIVADHRPYHAALADLLQQARLRYGIALLLDVHSMPPIADGPRLVIGDRFGRSASGRFIARIEGVARTLGVPSALNTPYAGGHILDRHADPARGIHAIQLEFDRTLYLDASLDRPGAGLEQAADLLRAVIDALRDEALPLPHAAE